MRKLALAAISFSAAIFTANFFLPEYELAALSAVATAGLLLYAIGRRRVKALGTALFFFALGLFCFHIHSRNTLEKAELLAGETCMVAAEVQDFPEVYDDYCRLNVRLKSADLPKFKAILYDNDKKLCDAKPGDIVCLKAKISPADTLYGEDYDNYHSKGIYFKLSSQGSEQVIRSFDAAYIPRYVSNWLSGHISSIFPADTEVFMRSLMLGDKSDFYDDTRLYVDMSRAGLMHIVAVSGMHISFLVGLLQGILGKGRRSALICIALVWLFALVTGSGPSVLRAAFMHSYFLMAPILRRENDSVTSLSVILAILLAINPFAAASISLQLSFGAMCGIVLFADKINRALLGVVPAHAGRGLVRTLTASVACSLSVMVFTVPLTVIHFGNVQLLSPVTNLISLWAVSICFCWGWFSCALSVIPFVGTVSAWLCSWLARYIFLAAGLISSMPFSVMYMETLPAWIWLFASYAMFILAYLFRKHRMPAFILAFTISAVSAAAVIIGSAAYSRTYDSINVLDVGQGQCISILSPEAAVVLDCGNINTVDDAGMKAAAHLYSRGRDSVDLLVLSHLHEDHADGAVMLMEMIKVRNLALPADCDAESGIYRQIVETAVRNGTKLIPVDYDMKLSVGGIEIEFIKSGYGEDENERCLITRLELSGAQLLAMADASCRMEQKLVEEHDLSDTDVLVVSHHGSKYSNCDVLLDEARAELAVISVGYNYYGHPAEETLEALQTYGYNVLRTDLDGDIEIKIGNSYGKKTWEK